MTPGERKYILILALAMVAFVLFQLFGKKPYDWTITLYSEDKNPFGTYVLNETLPDLFTKIDKSYSTIYEMADSTYQNLLILTTGFYIGDEDRDVLLTQVSEGSNVFISAGDFSFELADTLGFEISDYEIDAPLFERSSENPDSITLSLAGGFNDPGEYTFPVDNMYSQFDIIDSTNIRVIAVNDANNPVMIQVPFGKGNFYFNSTPLVFSNHFLLQKNHHKLAGQLLSFLPQEEVHWTEYYMVGRPESGSPLRYVLSEEALSWAYYLIIIGLLLFMIFDARRRQRIIPVITPLRNTSLDFVRTISNLYFQHKDHKNIADKRISFFLERIRKAYFLQDYLQGKVLYEKVAAKSGHSPEEVETLFSTMYSIRQKPSISEDELKRLNTLIENFRL